MKNRNELPLYHPPGPTQAGRVEEGLLGVETGDIRTQQESEGKLY